MIETLRSPRGMVTAPHHLAASAGLRVLAEGGNAIEAMLAAASTIAVVYPHMNGLGGDNFWLVHVPGSAPTAIAASGAAAAAATPAFYRERDCAEIPARGATAALTVAGAVGGWQLAETISREHWGGRLPLSRLLEDAIAYASDGMPVTRSQHVNTVAKMDELAAIPGFADTWLDRGEAPAAGALLKQERLAAVLERLARRGLDDFYRGDVARALASDLERAGSPLRLADLEQFEAGRVEPLRTQIGGNIPGATLFNLPPPTQGLASLLLLAIYARMPAEGDSGFDFTHRLVEATKQAFEVRDRYVTDPAYMRAAPGSFLTQERVDAMAAAIDPARAAPWPAPAPGGDTVWLAAADGDGRMVSFIQSLYWEFGSGLVLPASGIGWQNRGTSFSLDERALNVLVPGRKPFHTIQPALAHLDDGRVMAYGTMGGEGQPQTQAMIFARHVLHGRGLQASVSAPRWLLGRTWGADTADLKLEAGLADLAPALRAAGHDVALVGDFDPMMGHGGAIVRDASGVYSGASDPRSDGAVAAF